jgi:hypothetical protein
MKVTKTQLREIIREEISNLNKQLSLFENWILSEDGDVVLNPKSGRKIKVSTALSYPKDHPAYKAAVKLNPSSNTSTPSKKISIKKSNWKIEDGSMSVQAISELEDIMNSTLGIKDGVADLDYYTGAIGYYPNTDSQSAILIGPSDDGKYSVTVEMEDGDMLDDAEFDTPQEAIQFATKMAKKHKDKF